MNIKQFKRIDKNNGMSVYLAVRAQVKDFIDSNPDNSIFPSERKLTEQLGVNRRTLRKALEPFTGLLVRGPMGTVLKKQTFPNSSISIDELHPQLFQNTSFFPQTRCTFTLGIYENLPYQQKFWTEIIEEFNKTNDSCEIVLEFISKATTNFNKYISDALSGKTHFDLVQLPVHCTSLYDEKNLLRRHNQSFIDHIASDTFSIKNIFKYVPDYMEKVLPVYHVPKVQIVNPQFTSKNFTEVFCDLMNESPMKAWEKACEQIPNDVYLTNHIADLFSSSGLPCSENEQDSENIINELYDIIAPIKNREKLFTMSLLPDYFVAESIKYLLQEKVFSAYIYANFIRFIEDSNKDQIVLLTDNTVSNRVYLSSEVALGICGNCNEPNFIEELGRFLLSESVQKRIVHEINSLPFNYQAANCLDEVFTIRGNLKKAHSKYSLFSKDMCKFHFSKNKQQFWHEVISKNLSKKDAVERILNN